MNATFEPTLLFIGQEDWNDPQKRDAFLESLLCHLEAIGDYGIGGINWTDELQLKLVEHPQIHPWFQSDLRNPLIVTLHQKFYARLDFVPSHEQACRVEPAFNKTFPANGIHEDFLRLVHALLQMDEDFYFCVGDENRLLAGRYAFHGQDKTHSPELLNHCDDWLGLLDAVALFYPQNIQDFDEKMDRAIALLSKQLFGGKSSRHGFEFTKTFKKDLLRAVNHRDSILEAITRRLVSTAREAQQSPLADEYIQQSGQHRFRVTQRPYSTRIHYDWDAGKIRFLRYYDEGEHDAGL